MEEFYLNGNEEVDFKALETLFEYLFVDVTNLKRVNLRGIIKSNTNYKGILEKVVHCLKE
jgi:hypothetical protein